MYMQCHVIILLNMCTIDSCVRVYTYYVYTTAYRIRFNFRGVKPSRNANFRGFRVFIFAFCDVIAQALHVWSKFSWDETFADGY